MNDQKNSRRNFIKNSSLAGALGLAIPSIVSTAFAAEKSGKRVRIQKDDVILLQGDSITDSGRRKEEMNPNVASAFGNGYALIAASELLMKGADKNLKIYNKGISGNKVYQVAERWQKDCIDLKPTVVSVHIGVNDFWHTLTNKYTGTIKTYRDDYTALLKRTKEQLPGVQFIIGEPFAVTGIKSVDEKWYPTFNDYRAAARDIADEFDAVFIPYQSIFDKAQQSAPGVYWTYDGVHPSLAGAQLMAHSWLQAVKV
jgi:lysophospholipase L1-like esterase